MIFCEAPKIRCVLEQYLTATTSLLWPAQESVSSPVFRSHTLTVRSVMEQKLPSILVNKENDMIWNRAPHSPLNVAWSILVSGDNGILKCYGRFVRFVDGILAELRQTITNVITVYIASKSMRAIWMVNQLWFIAPVNPWKNRASSELLYISNRPQVSTVCRLINHLGCW